MREWRGVIVTNRQEMEREEEMVSEARAQLTRLRLVRVLQTWRERVYERVLEARATLHHQQWLKQRVLLAWKYSHVTLLRKRMLRAQGEMFENSRLLSSCYIRWRQQVRVGECNTYQGVLIHGV